MKKCPECGREYDLSMSFCLDDGAELLYGPASVDEPATAILSEPRESAGGQFSESATRPQIYTTAGAPPRGSLERSTERQSVPAPGRGSVAGTPQLSAHRSAKPMLASGFVILLLAAGFFGYRYLNTAGGDQINSIAVLPFQNRSDDADTEYLIGRPRGIADISIDAASGIEGQSGEFCSSLQGQGN